MKHLRRRDELKNMARAYAIDVQPELLGGVFVLREWGRIGRAGRVKLDFYADPVKALDAADRLVRAKIRRGYR